MERILPRSGVGVVGVVGVAGVVGVEEAGVGLDGAEVVAGAEVVLGEFVFKLASTRQANVIFC